MEGGFWKGDYDLLSVVGEVYDTSPRLPGSNVGGYWCMWGCGPAVDQWDNHDGKAAAGNGKDCGVGQWCTLPG